MKLMELFDSKPEPISWSKKTNMRWTGKFNADNIPYVIDFVGPEGKWEISFNIDKKGKMSPDLKSKIKGHKDLFGIIGTGNQGKVFSTVISALKELIKKEKPYSIQFSAEESSRMKLYKKMVGRFAGALGYIPKMTGDYFELVKIIK